VWFDEISCSWCDFGVILWCCDFQNPKSHQNHTKITPRPGFENQVRKKHEKTWKNFSVQTSEMVSDARLNHNACSVLTGQTQLCFKMCCVDRLKMFRDDMKNSCWGLIYKPDICDVVTHLEGWASAPREFCWVQNPPRAGSPHLCLVHSSWPGAVVAPQALTQSVCRSRRYWPPRNRAR